MKRMLAHLLRENNTILFFYKRKSPTCRGFFMI
jgi:hypothetical protein